MKVSIKSFLCGYGSFCWPCSMAWGDVAPWSDISALNQWVRTANDSAEDYYYIQIGNCTASSLGLSSAANTMEGLISSLGLAYGGPNTLNTELWWGTVPPQRAKSVFANCDSRRLWPCR